MKKQLKINFENFWPHFDKENNIFYNILSKYYILTISKNPQLLIFTNDYNKNKSYLNYNCHKLFVSLENERTDFNSCDFVIDFDYLSKKNHLRFPLWALWDLKCLENKKRFTLEDIKHKKECCFVVSNANAKERIKFFKKLNNYISIDSGGRFMNNIGRPVNNKIEFIKDYKFVISFENSSRAGYCTEKLIEPLLAGVIPIYWGDPKIGNDFNSNSFINIHDYPSEEAAIDHIVSLINNSEEYLKLLNRSCFRGNVAPTKKYHRELEKFLIASVDSIHQTTPISKTYKRFIHLLNLKKNSFKSIILNALNLNFR